VLVLKLVFHEPELGLCVGVRCARSAVRHDVEFVDRRAGHHHYDQQQNDHETRCVFFFHCWNIVGHSRIVEHCPAINSVVTSGVERRGEVFCIIIPLKGWKHLSSERVIACQVGRVRYLRESCESCIQSLIFYVLDGHLFKSALKTGNEGKRQIYQSEISAFHARTNFIFQKQMFFFVSFLNEKQVFFKYHFDEHKNQIKNFLNRFVSCLSFADLESMSCNDFVQTSTTSFRDSY